MAWEYFPLSSNASISTAALNELRYAAAERGITVPSPIVECMSPGPWLLSLMNYIASAIVDNVFWYIEYTSEYNYVHERFVVSGASNPGSTRNIFSHVFGSEYTSWPYWPSSNRALSHDLLNSVYSVLDALRYRTATKTNWFRRVTHSPSYTSFLFADYGGAEDALAAAAEYAWGEISSGEYGESYGGGYSGQGLWSLSPNIGGDYVPSLWYMASGQSMSLNGELCVMHSSSAQDVQSPTPLAWRIRLSLGAHWYYSFNYIPIGRAAPVQLRRSDSQPGSTYTPSWGTLIGSVDMQGTAANASHVPMFAYAGSGETQHNFGLVAPLTQPEQGDLHGDWTYGNEYAPATKPWDEAVIGSIAYVYTLGNYQKATS